MWIDGRASVCRARHWGGDATIGGDNRPGTHGTVARQGEEVPFTHEVDTTPPIPCRAHESAAPEVAKSKLPLTICLALMYALAASALAEAPPLLTVEYQITQQQVVGLVPEGLRIDFHLAGTFTDGIFAGATVEGVDY